MGVRHENVIMCDSKGVIWKGREGIDQFKSAHAIDTDKRTLAEAVKGTDIFLGLSVAGAMTQEMVKSMAANPIIFAMANPDPEITPPDAMAVRPDAIVATGRGRTIPTRSTTCSASPSSSAARSMCGQPRSTRK